MGKCFFLLCAGQMCVDHHVCKIIGSNDLRPEKMLYSHREWVGTLAIHSQVNLISGIEVIHTQDAV